MSIASMRTAPMSIVDAMILNEEQLASYNALTGHENYGGAIAYWSKPCVVVYSVPVWIMPNGFCRVGDPNADMVDTQEAIAEIRRRTTAVGVVAMNEPA